MFLFITLILCFPLYKVHTVVWGQLYAYGALVSYIVECLTFFVYKKVELVQYSEATNSNVMSLKPWKVHCKLQISNCFIVTLKSYMGTYWYFCWCAGPYHEFNLCWSTEGREDYNEHEWWHHPACGLRWWGVCICSHCPTGYFRNSSSLWMECMLIR